jgi:hypothetical protein
MNLHMLPKTGWMRVRLITTPDFTIVRLVTGVHMAVLLTITRVGESPVTTLKLTLEGFLTCMSSFVYFEVF